MKHWQSVSLALAATAGFLVLSWPSPSGPTVGAAALAAVNPADAVSIAIEPAAASLAVGEFVIVELRVNAGAQQVDRVDAFVDFNPAVLQVVDASGRPAASITPGATLTQVSQNRVDAAAGQISYSAGRDAAAPPASGSFAAATIRFRGVAAGSSRVEFSLTSPRTTTVYAPAKPGAPASNILTATANGAVTVTQGAGTPAATATIAATATAAVTATSGAAAATVTPASGATSTPTTTSTPPTAATGVPPAATASPGGNGAPALTGPDDGITVNDMAPLLRWTNPAGTTQYQIQVLPFNNDGPGINLIRNAETSYQVQAPVLGQGEYVLLPGMSYTWRVRTTSATTSVSENDPGWSAWVTRRFRTAPPSSAGLRPVGPADGSPVESLTPTLTWDHSERNVFYYEVQVSQDPAFNDDPTTAIASVYWNLVHGGQTVPLNSYTIPAGYPLEPASMYYWRVRPRVQGDGVAVAWSPTWVVSTHMASARPAYADGVVLVRFQPGSSAAERVQAWRSAGAVSSEPLSPLAVDAAKLTLGPGIAVDRAIQELARNPIVVYAEPDYLVTHQAISDDPYYTNGSLWGMYGDATSPANQYGSQAGEAWAAGHVGSSTIYVGVIDEGIQFTHPELTANVWTNPNDPVDGIDNDGNGHIDDVHGWDFVSNDNTIYDGVTDDHGTHVAGTIGAKGGNSAGVAGVNWNVTLISAKFLGPSGGTMSGAVQAADYLTSLKQQGLNIVVSSNSWGGGGFSQSLLDAINRGGDAGILFVAAAGNNGGNNDATAFYPANYQCTTRFDTNTPRGWDCVIAVASITSAGAKSSFSQYGATTVDLGAPGSGITSTLPTSTYGSYSGTSMATPHVSGAAALCASISPALTAQQIKSAILSTAAPTASLAGITATGGRLDIMSMAGACQTLAAVPDLYIKDLPTDAGIEPNPAAGPMWVSDDIWVRTTQDPGYQSNPYPESNPPWTPLPHQNPEYRAPQSGLPNYLYVRVHNRGNAASSGAEQLKLNFAKASTGLAWPAQWVNYVVNGVLYGAEITANAPVVLPVLQPGQAVVLQIPWYPPNPADFASFGADQGHFCLLARLETSTVAPFGMTFPEGAAVYTNTKDNNNIAWKNLTVVDIVPGGTKVTSVIVRNVFRERAPTGFRFEAPAGRGASFFDFGRIVVDLKPALFERWRAGGAVGKGIEAVGGSRLRITSATASIENILLEPGEAVSVDVSFELLADARAPQGGFPMWDLIQIGTPENRTAIVGGQRFEIRFR